MAAIKAMPPGFEAKKKMKMLNDLVEPRKQLDVPNHILDTQIFNKLAQNSLVKIQPSVVHFGGYNLNKAVKRTFKICNASAERQNVHIIPPATKFFKISYSKPDRFVPGFTIDVTVYFTADEWRYYYDCIRIHSKGNENIIVPLHAFPVMDTSKFPRKLLFPPSSVSLGGSCSKILPLYSSCPIDFEFQITVTQPHPAITVSPKSGIVPGEGEKDIVVTYTPTEYVTANMTIQLVISQFNTEPLYCHITASCNPVSKSITSRSVKDSDELYKQTKVFDPRCISPMTRRRQKVLIKKDQEIVYDGFQFPTKLNTQHAVNSVLMQEKGKLKVKDLREAVIAKQQSNESSGSEALTSLGSTRQMKEAAFDKIVRQDVVEERANQLRWQVHLGNEPISDEARMAVQEQRKNAAYTYKYNNRKEPFVDSELVRPVCETTFRRSIRKANQIPVVTACFDLYKNNSWSVRHRAMARFQQAARTVLIRRRADKKVVMLKKMVEDFKSGKVPDQFPVVTSTDDLKTGMSPFQVDIHGHNGISGKDPLEVLRSTFTYMKVKPFTFPVYVSPDTKEDIAPDALGEVPCKGTDVTAKRNVPFHDLVVPKYYELAGYVRHDVYESLNSYVTPGLVRQLRVGAEDEIIKGTFANQEFDDKSQLEEIQSVEQKGGRDSVVKSLSDSSSHSAEKQSSSGLIPPTGLFKNAEKHRLYIFNRSPGVVHHYLPIEYSEIDPDFHLCPIPRYTILPNAKKFLHRQDVIKGTMQWKKFSSHGLSSLTQSPTISNVWLPRWSDCFSQALIPQITPDLLTDLPEEDKSNLLLEGSQNVKFPLLTPEMVMSNFPMEKELQNEFNNPQTDEITSPKKEEPFSTSRFPNPSTKTAKLGSTMSEEKEQLELTTKLTYNKLGRTSNALTKLCDFEIDE